VIFLLIPILLTVEGPVTAAVPRSLPIDDIFEEASCYLKFTDSPPEGEEFPDVGGVGVDVLRLGAMKSCRSALESICEVQHLSSSLSSYRLSRARLNDALKVKVDRLAADETFDGRFPTLQRGIAKSGIGIGHGDNPEIIKQARLTVAIDLVSQYLPIEIEETLRESYSLTELQAFLESSTEDGCLSNGHLPAVTSNIVSAASKPKPAGGGSAALKKKADQGKATRGVEALKKVNTRNMKKIDSFFTKKSA